MVRARYAEPLTVDDMARAAGMSRFHFSRALRAACNCSPYQLVVQTRLEAAAALLRAGRASSTQAALSVGFTDPSRFARAFRRAFGCAPSEMAARH